MQTSLTVPSVQHLPGPRHPRRDRAGLAGGSETRRQCLPAAVLVHLGHDDALPADTGAQRIAAQSVPPSSPGWVNWLGPRRCVGHISVVSWGTCGARPSAMICIHCGNCITEIPGSRAEFELRCGLEAELRPTVASQIISVRPLTESRRLNRGRLYPALVQTDDAARCSPRATAS